MLAPKGSTYNGRPTFANPMYLKKAQSEKPCLYEIPYDTYDLANRFTPDREETLTLEQERKSISKSRQAYNVMTNNINHFKLIVDQAWKKHVADKFHAPTSKDMTVLVETCLMPLAIKTQNDSFQFVHEIKQEIFADLQYVQSLEKHIDELESDKANFSNIYDLLLQYCVSKDVMCSYFHSLSDFDAYNELQCLYLYKIKECECLAEKLSKQTENVSKEEKNIAISELKKLLEKMKGKGVDTNFEKQSILGKPPLQPIRNQLVSPRESVSSNDMVHNYYLEEVKNKEQLQKDKALNITTVC
ncbi:hypothetical protein Tco_0865212 [Tanacetum coccineum]